MRMKLLVFIALMIANTSYAQDNCLVKARTLKGFDDVPYIAIISYDKGNYQTQAMIMSKSGMNISQANINKFTEGFRVSYTDASQTAGIYMQPLVFAHAEDQKLYDEGIVIENADDLAELKKRLIEPKSYQDVCNNTLVVLPIETPKPVQVQPVPAKPKPKIPAKKPSRS